MKLNRRAAFLCLVFLMTAVGCDAKFDNSPEGDAELLCLEQGLVADTDEYNDCVEGQ
jgi:hypothetical protein